MDENGKLNTANTQTTIRGSNLTATQSHSDTGDLLKSSIHAGSVYDNALNDPKYHPETGTTTKMKHNVSHADGTSTEIHYDVDRETGERSGFKIKDDTNEKSRGYNSTHSETWD